MQMSREMKHLHYKFTRTKSEKEKVIFVGDGINDVEMMKKAKIASSANEAFEGLRGVCNHHTDDVAGFLENLCDM